MTFFKVKNWLFFLDIYIYFLIGTWGIFFFFFYFIEHGVVGSFIEPGVVLVVFNFCQFTVCWGLFFRPTWHYFIGNPCHINILLIFWVNLFKVQNKLIFHSTTWIGLTWPVRSLLQEADSGSTFPFHQLGS